MNAQDVAAHLDGCRAAHRRLLAHLESASRGGLLDDFAITQTSLLPGWTIGHVLAHLARNADSHVRVIDAARAGQSVPQYAGGTDARAAAIEADAGRAALVQIADVAGTIDALEDAWLRAAEGGWSGSFVAATGEIALSEVVFRRWREVEVHHADLGLEGFGVDDWSAEYVATELPGRVEFWCRRHGGASDLPPAAAGLTPARRLAWLLGRVDPPGLEHVAFA